MQNETINPEDIMVTIGGKWGDANLSLADWVRNGPSDRYFFQTPGKAWHRVASTEIPLDKIPRPFRNDTFSVMLILDGLVSDPWNREIELLKFHFEMFLGIHKEECERQYKQLKSDFLKGGQSEDFDDKTLAGLCWKIINAS